MAAPIITGTVPASPVSFSPGQTINIQVVASDPDAGPPVTQVFKVKDSGGNESSISVQLQVADPLTYSADPAPSGWVVTNLGNGLFSVKAP